MLDEKPDNPFVYPLEDTNPAQEGIRLRDYFAGRVVVCFAGQTADENAARCAYVIADAMLKARED